MAETQHTPLPPIRSTNPQVWIGILIVSIGLVVLAITRRYISVHFPILSFLFPLVILIGVLYVAFAAKNAVVGTFLGFLVLLAFIGIFSGADLLRSIVGIMLIVAGVGLFVYAAGTYFKSR